jgi:hypothetical protein
MTAHVSHEGVQLRGCIALVALTPSLVAREAAVAAGGVGAAAGALKAHGRGSSALAEHASRALAHLLPRGSGAHQAAAASAGAVEALVAALRAHGPGERESGGFFAGVFGAPSTPAAPLTTPRAGGGATPRASTAGHRGACEAACRALARVASGNERAQAAAVRAGAVELVLATARTHGAAHAGVAEASCAALWSLCNTTASRDAKTRAARAHALPHLAALLATHRAHAGVVEAGCRALRSVAIAAPSAAASSSSSDPFLGTAIEAALAAVVSGMRAHMDEASLQAQACAALRNLIAHDNAEEEIAIELGAIEAVVAALRAHPGHAGVVAHACGALSNLTCASKRSQLRASAAGAEAALERALSLVRRQQHARGGGSGSSAGSSFGGSGGALPPERAEEARELLRAIAAARRAESGETECEPECERACGCVPTSAKDSALPPTPRRSKITAFGE